MCLKVVYEVEYGRECEEGEVKLDEVTQYLSGG
jgi:hypothetical protein